MQSDLLNYVPAEGLLHERVIIVTGAAMGIGKAVAVQYARFGATVVLVDKQELMLDAVYDEMVAAGYPEPVICKLDLLEATADAYNHLALMIKQELGRLDGLVLNAAWLGMFMATRQYDLSLWTKMMQINLNANFLLVRACLPLLEKSPDAAIVFSTDTTDRAYYGAYGVSKAAMNAFCDILAQEYDAQPFIRVNRIHPGPVRTSTRVLSFPGEHPDSNVHPESIVGPYLYFMGPDAGKRTGEALQLGKVPADFQWAGEQG